MTAEICAGGAATPCSRARRLQKLFEALEGEEVRVVGGAVRNALLGVEVADIDLAAAALPETIAEKARKGRTCASCRPASSTAR